MTIQPITYQIFQSKWKMKPILSVCLALFILATIVLDYLFSHFQNSAFYISESLLFSTYWVLFFPLLTFVLKLIKKTEKVELKLLCISSAIIFHLFSYPTLVWILSKTFYYHTFPYWQTFNFGLSTYLIKTVIIYGFSLAAFTLLNKTIQAQQRSKEAAEEADKKNFISSILISDGHNKKLLLQVNDILYFSANSPYINIYHLSKKHLYTETLKSLENQLNDNQFVRIHKSYIVNIDKISSIQSRQNGDYDIALSDHTILRLSRNYAKNFKSRFAEQHQLTIR